MTNFEFGYKISIRAKTACIGIGMAMYWMQDVLLYMLIGEMSSVNAYASHF
jgi:hypothetical protein